MTAERTKCKYGSHDHICLKESVMASKEKLTYECTLKSKQDFAKKRKRKIKTEDLIFEAIKINSVFWQWPVFQYSKLNCRVCW